MIILGEVFSLKKEVKILLGLIAILMASGYIFYMVSESITESMITKLNDSNISNKTTNTITYDYTDNETHNGTQHTITVTTTDYT